MALLAAYSFDEASGSVLDYSGNARHFALNANLARSVTGHTSFGATKTGTGMPVVASPSFVGTGAWTMMFWRQGLGDTVWWCRLYNTVADTGSGILLLGGTLRVRIRKTGNTEATTTPPGDGGWHHYAATYDGSVGRLYVDAALVATTATSTAPTAAVDRIDMLEHTSPDTFTDDLRFYDTALNQATISALKDTPVTASAEAHSGSVALTATAGLIRSGAKATARAVGLTATAGVTRAGSRSTAASVPLAAGAELDAAGIRASTGAVPLSALAGAAAVGSKAAALPAPLVSTALLTPTGSSHRAGSVALSATATLTAVEASPVQPPATVRCGRAPRAVWGIEGSDAVWSSGRAPSATWRSGT